MRIKLWIFENLRSYFVFQFSKSLSQILEMFNLSCAFIIKNSKFNQVIPNLIIIANFFIDHGEAKFWFEPDISRNEKLISNKYSLRNHRTLEIFNNINGNRKFNSAHNFENFELLKIWVLIEM
jgi:hypothetical protein